MNDMKSFKLLTLACLLILLTVSASPGIAVVDYVYQFSPSHRTVEVSCQGKIFEPGVAMGTEGPRC